MKKNRVHKKILAGLLFSAVVLVGVTVCISPVVAQPTIVSIQNATADPGETVTVPVNIIDVTDLATANIWLFYDKDVVIVDSVSAGDLGSITVGINNTNGVTKMNWFSATGQTGDFVFAYVTLTATGSKGDTSPLDLDVKELGDSGANPITHTVEDGQFEIPPPPPAIVSIQNATADPGETVTVPVNITDVTDLAAANIWLFYDKDVVIVDNVSAGDLGSITVGINNTNGVTKMNWFSATGQTGDFVFAYVTLTATGSKGDTSPLDLDVKELGDSGANPITHTVEDGQFEIPLDTTPPEITDMDPTGTITDTTPTISASYSDPEPNPSGINETSVILKLDGEIVTPDEITESSVTYTPTTALSYATHTVILNVSDYAGKTATETWTFTVEAPSRPRGGRGGVPPDSDDDGDTDIKEMLAGTDKDDPCDPNPESAACLALKPAATPTPTPTPKPTPTPTIPPTVAPTTPTPTPTPEPPGFEAVFAIAGLLAVAYLVLRRKRK